MTAVDLDPVFVKALKFLHSKAKDSGAQLKALLDDAIAQRKGLKAPVHSGDLGKSSPGRSKSDEDLKRKEAEKRLAERVLKDSSEPDIKKAKLDSKTKSKDERDVREKEKEKERAKRDKEKKEKEERDAQKLKEKLEKERKEKELIASKIESEAPLLISDEEEAARMDAGDFALEMGIACVVCKQFDVSSGNQLVECQECHSLYHQECHKPPVTEEDVSDPRFVWYCSRCSRSLKKMVTQKPAKPKPPTPTISSVKEPSAAPVKSTKLDMNSKNVSQAFRRIDPKSIVTPTDTATLASTAVKPMVGLAGLAANLHKSKGESKTGTASRKTDQKGDVGKASSKVEAKSSSGSGGYKSDSSSKSGSSSSNKSDIPSKPKLEEKKQSGKADDKKGNDTTLKSSPTEKEERKPESLSKSEKTLESGKSPSNYEQNKSDVSPPKSSPPHVSTPTTPASPDCPSPSKSSSSSTSNKQAVANLSLVTANKRIQMMKKKAQAKPGSEKKLHIK